MRRFNIKVTEWYDKKPHDGFESENFVESVEELRDIFKGNEYRGDLAQQIWDKELERGS